MKREGVWAAGILGAVALAAIAWSAYRLGMDRGRTDPSRATASAQLPASSATPGRVPQGIAEGEAATRRHIATGLKAGEVDPATGRKILYYHDPMVPGNKFDKPAKSPFMDMMLVPVYGGAEGDENNVSVSPRIQQNLGVRTALVVEGTLSPQVSAVGSIAFNERDQAVIQARAAGFIEQLHVRATLDAVKKGQPLVDLYVPEWIAAQEEFLSVRRMQGGDMASLVDGARQRMRQVGMNDEQIRTVESTGRTQPRISIRSPLDGVVVESMAHDGMTVAAGATLFRINGLGTVWANAEVPESQAAQLRPGAKVQARSPAVPGVTFEGTVQALLPEVNTGTRTLKARMQLANPGARLVPGMFVTMDFMDTRPGKVLLVPSDAVIQTGKRTVVLLAEENGHFQPVDVQSGLESNGQTEIRSGLKAGQRIVVSSQFLIDSEASLRGVEARLNESPAAVASNPASVTPVGSARHVGTATVQNVGTDALTLAHGPIPTMKWGAMTMDFKLPQDGRWPAVKAGDRIAFEFELGADGLPQLTKVTPLAPGKQPVGASGSGSRP